MGSVFPASQSASTAAVHFLAHAAINMDQSAPVEYDFRPDVGWPAQLPEATDGSKHPQVLRTHAWLRGGLPAACLRRRPWLGCRPEPQDAGTRILQGYVLSAGDHIMGCCRPGLEMDSQPGKRCRQRDSGYPGFTRTGMVDRSPMVAGVCHIGIRVERPGFRHDHPAGRTTRHLPRTV